MFLRMVHHRLGIQQAIDAPSFPLRALAVAASGRASPGPESWCSKAASPTRCWTSCWRAATTPSKGEDWSEGRLSGARLEADGQMYAGANPRGMQGYAVGR